MVLWGQECHIETLRGLLFKIFVVFCVALVKHFGWNDWQDYFQWQTFGLMHVFGLFLLCLTFYIGHMTECADVQKCM